MDSEMKNRITQRLAAIGYTYASADDFLLDLVFEKIEGRIFHACNIQSVPEGCMEAEIIDAVCGEFLAGKKASGNLTGVEIEAIVKAITEGDTKVEFATGNTGAADIFDAYMTKLATIDPNAIVAHRKMVW